MFDQKLSRSSKLLLRTLTHINAIYVIRIRKLIHRSCVIARKTSSCCCCFYQKAHILSFFFRLYVDECVYRITSTYRPSLQTEDLICEILIVFSRNTTTVAIWNFYETYTYSQPKGIKKQLPYFLFNFFFFCQFEL